MDSKLSSRWAYAAKLPPALLLAEFAFSGLSAIALQHSTFLVDRNRSPKFVKWETPYER